VEDGKLGLCKAKGEKKRMAKEEKRVLRLKLEFSMHRRNYLLLNTKAKGSDFWAFRL
jgi:hypothetical protein